MNKLELLKILKDNEEIKIQIRNFEKSTKILIPPAFKIFLENYDLRSHSESHQFRIYHEEKGGYTNFDDGEFTPNPEVGIESFLNPDEYLSAKENIYHYEEDNKIIKDKIVVGNIFGGTLLLGYQENNLDFIYSDFITESTEKRLTKVAENIFEFFKSFSIYPNSDSLNNINVNLDNLYRKWGDNFWRINE